MSCRGEDCCGHSYPMSQYFMIILDLIREEAGGPVICTSGFRCRIHNAAEGGVENSFHTLGLAADLVPTTCSLEELKAIADKYCSEVIMYEEKGFVHVANPIW